MMQWSKMRRVLPWVPASLLMVVALYPAAARWGARTSAVAEAPDQIALGRIERLSPLLASWQTVGGCGASAASGSGVGVKWVGRGASGGLFNVQTMSTYSRLTDPTDSQRQLFVTSLITRDLGDAWQLGVSIPYVYKFIYSPFGEVDGRDLDLSNSGLGDVFLQTTHRFGAIRDTLVTLQVGLPTGKWNTAYRMKYLRQDQQLGFGKVVGGLTVDHVMDQVWGLVVVGASGAYRGGQNALGSYRAPSASAYAFAGYFLGPVVPAIGVSVTGFAGHDKDQTVQENSSLVLAAPTASLEWSTDWIAVLLGASFPYQYDGITKDSMNLPRKSYGFGVWSVSLGITLSPF
jgi:hypothetical protein